MQGSTNTLDERLGVTESLGDGIRVTGSIQAGQQSAEGYKDMAVNAELTGVASAAVGSAVAHNTPPGES